jgi:hypothetical protein
MISIAICGCPGARRLGARLPAGVRSVTSIIGTMANEPAPQTEAGEGAFLASLMDTELYSIGAYFCDEHPDLVDELVTRSDEIESRGLRTFAEEGGTAIEEAFETLLTGIAVRYYKAVAG